MQPFRKRTRVGIDRGVNLRRVPFKPGTPVEVIILPARVEEPLIYGRMEAVVRRRRIPRYSLKDIARIVHESRGVRA